jgi:hypothetical protein
MMENRSFDHMLGYLRIDGVNNEVEGLQDSDRFGARHPDGTFHRVEPLGDRLSTIRLSIPATERAMSRSSSTPGGGSSRATSSPSRATKADPKRQGKKPFPPDREFDPTLRSCISTYEHMFPRHPGREPALIWTTAPATRLSHAIQRHRSAPSISPLALESRWT